ncbi:MAG: FG-GAP repeat domain-containing protein, partial [Gemmata sp.]
PPAVPTATTNTSFTVTPFNQHNVYRIDFAVALQSLTYSTLTGRVTADTASTGALRTGALVTIAGATQAAYNGTFAITVLNGTQFTYTPLTAPPVTTATTATGFTASPAAPGAYKIVLGPNITDSGGNKMDQNRNGIDGEVPTQGKFGDDTFTGYLYANTGAVAPADGTGTKGPFVPTVYGTAANGVTFALVSNGSSFTTAGWSNFLALRTDLAPSLLNTLTGDFNGDGKADIAMRFKEGSGRQFQQWWVGVSNGSSLTFTLWGEWATGTWVDVLAGDFDGSGKDSITGRFLGSNPNADPALNGKDAVFVARSTGTSFVSTFWNAWVPRPWLDVRVGDFNGDGKADLVAGIIQNGLRNVFVAESSGSIFTQKYWQSWNAVITWADVRVGDFDGDGKSDLIGRVKENGKVYVSTDYAPSPVQTGGQKFWQQWNTAVNWLNVQVGDFDGDGKSDLLSVASLPGSAADGRMFVSRNFNKTLTYRPTLSPATAGTTFDGQQLWLARPGLATNWGNVISADFTGDGKSDVVMRYLGPAAPASGAQPALVTGRWYVARANPTGTGFILEDWKAAWGSVGGLTPQASWSNVRGGSHL